MAALLEHDAKRMMAGAGLPVPAGGACADVAEVASQAALYGPRVVVKALIPSKGKQCAGGILFADSAAEAEAAARRLLGSTVAGFRVSHVLVEHREEIFREIYISIALDGRARAYSLVIVADGGADVERRLAEGAGAQLYFGADAPPSEAAVRSLLLRAGIDDMDCRHVAATVERLCALALEIDATLVEINPLAILADGSCSVLGTLVTLDESALSRHPALASQALLHVDQLQRPLTAWEHEIDAINAALPDGGEVRFGEFQDGDIGMMVLGGGAGLVALDAVSRRGGRPANFFDMTSSAGNVTEKCYKITKSFLLQKRLRGLLIGSNIGAFLPVPLRLSGIAQALREELGNRLGFPITIRLAGVDDDNAHELLAGLPVSYFRDEVTIEDAVNEFMDRLEFAA